MPGLILFHSARVFDTMDFYVKNERTGELGEPPRLNSATKGPHQSSGLARVYDPAIFFGREGPLQKTGKYLTKRATNAAVGDEPIEALPGIGD